MRMLIAISLASMIATGAAAQQVYNASEVERAAFERPFGLLMPAAVCDVKPSDAAFMYLWNFGTSHTINGKTLTSIAMVKTSKQRALMMKAPAAKQSICAFMKSAAGKRQLEDGLSRGAYILKAEHAKLH